MASHIIHTGLVILLLLIANALSSQTIDLDQILHGSDKDSISLRDYVTGGDNHLLILPPTDCDDCLSYYSEYRQAADTWAEDYNLQITILPERSSETSQVTLQVANQEQQSGLDVLLRGPSGTPSTTARLILLQANGTQVKEFSQFISAEAMSAEIAAYLNANNSNRSLLKSQTLQCLTDLSLCDQTSILLATKGSQQKNENIYTEVWTEAESYLLRESDDGRQVYLYSEQDEQEYLLLDFTARQCDTLELYSVMTQTIHQLEVLDYTYVNGLESWTLNRTLGCDQSEQYLTLHYGLGTNAGLIPYYDDSIVYTQLNCQYTDDILTYGNEEECPIDKPDELSQLLIFPNPTDGRLTVDSGWKDVLIVSLYTIDGRRLPLNQVDNNTLDLTRLPQGMYLLGVEKDARLTYYKVIKK